MGEKVQLSTRRLSALFRHLANFSGLFFDEARRQKAVAEAMLAELEVERQGGVANTEGRP